MTTARLHLLAPLQRATLASLITFAVALLERRLRKALAARIPPDETQV